MAAIQKKGQPNRMGLDSAAPSRYSPLMSRSPSKPPHHIVIKTPSRAELDHAFQNYGLQLGKLVGAWNRMHEQLAALFCLVVNSRNERIPLAIWHSIKSDRQQREILRQAIKAIRMEGNFKEEVIWILTKIDHSLAENRNDAIHAPLAFVTDALGTSMGPNWSSANPRAQALRGKNLLEEFRWLYETCDLLTGYATALEKFALRGNVPPRPERPSLPVRTSKASRPKA
ncbi:MAG: hypothetical protein ACJ8F3_02575 [Xanthobacteraceae bacterium]